VPRNDPGWSNGSSQKRGGDLRIKKLPGKPPQPKFSPGEGKKLTKTGVSERSGERGRGGTKKRNLGDDTPPTRRLAKNGTPQGGPTTLPKWTTCPEPKDAGVWGKLVVSRGHVARGGPGTQTFAKEGKRGVRSVVQSTATGREKTEGTVQKCVALKVGKKKCSELKNRNVQDRSTISTRYVRKKKRSQMAKGTQTFPMESTGGGGGAGAKNRKDQLPRLVKKRNSAKGLKAASRRG